jgi:hypothetical protein
MGLRRGDLAEYMAPHDARDAQLAERAQWLTTDPHSYAALTDAARPALDETSDLARARGIVPAPADEPWERLLALGRAWEVDFVWMHPDEAGAHRVIGGVVCFPSSWALRDKLGRTMSETHSPAPGLNAALDHQIETFFARLAPGDAWRRENVNYSRTPELNLHPLRPRPRLDAASTAADAWIRLEHQLLLKLPVTRSILFAIRIEVWPLLQIARLPGLADRLVRQLETMPEAVAEYKDVAKSRGSIVSSLRSAPFAADSPRAG